MRTDNATRRAGESIFEPGSQANREALVGLRALLEYLGFRVVKKIDKEATLRVYPRQIHGYPLLNPRFIRESGRRWVQIHVWSDAENPSLNRVLRQYAKSAGCDFFESGEQFGRYHLHGWLYLPIEVRDGGGKLPNFAALGHLLKRLHDYLKRAA